MQKPEETRAKILRGAMAAFSRHGLEGATTREIARMARVNEVTLFRHFKNKKQLLAEVVASHCEKYEPLFLERKFDCVEDLRETIWAFVRLSDQFLREHENFVRSIFGELSRQPALAKQLLGVSAYQKRDLLVKYITKGKEKKLVREEVDLLAAVALLQSMVLGYTIRRPLLEKEIAREVYLQSAVDLFLRGILV
jgi:AcrR family transcriptional regulator